MYFGLDVFCLFEARVPERDTQPLPPTAVDVYSTYTVYAEQCFKVWVSSFELAEYVKPKIQRRHLIADQRIHISYHLWPLIRTVLT